MIAHCFRRLFNNGTIPGVHSSKFMIKRQGRSSVQGYFANVSARRSANSTLSCSKSRSTAGNERVSHVKSPLGVLNFSDCPTKDHKSSRCLYIELRDATLSTTSGFSRTIRNTLFQVTLFSACALESQAVHQSRSLRHTAIHDEEQCTT